MPHRVLAMHRGIRLRAEKAVVRAAADLIGLELGANGRARRGIHRDLTRLLHAVAIGGACVVDDCRLLAWTGAPTRQHRRAFYLDERAAREVASFGIGMRAERLRARCRLRTG